MTTLICKHFIGTHYDVHTNWNDGFYQDNTYTLQAASITPYAAVLTQCVHNSDSICNCPSIQSFWWQYVVLVLARDFTGSQQTLDIQSSVTQQELNRVAWNLQLSMMCHYPLNNVCTQGQHEVAEDKTMSTHHFRTVNSNSMACHHQLNMHSVCYALLHIIA